jgi:hypothetical protein
LLVFGDLHCDRRHLRNLVERAVAERCEEKPVNNRNDSEREEHDETSRIRSATDEDVERLGKLVIGVPVKQTGSTPPSWLVKKLEREQSEEPEGA